jgi:hypothetical protein
MDTDAPSPLHLEKVIEGLSTNPALPAAMIRRLFAWHKGMRSVARRPDLTDAMIAEIIGLDDHWLLHSLALNETLPGRFRVELAGRPDKGVRAALVTRAETAPLEMLERLIDDPDRQVRTYLAKCDALPPDLRSRLAADPDPTIRAELAKQWVQAPEDVRRILLTDPEPKVRAAACSTYYARFPHPIPPADLVPALLADPVTRAGAVIHAALDADTLQLLAGDRDDEVRAELARHPDLPAPVRDVLADDPALNVRLKVFARADTPEDLRARLNASILELSDSVPDPGDDADDEAFLRWAQDTFAAMELRNLRLKWVADDPLPHVGSPYVSFRVSAASSKTLPPDAVARLLDDEEERVRIVMARTAPHLVDPDTAERVERRYRREDKFTWWWDMEEVLTFPQEYLRRFATDPDARIRSFAPRDPDLPAEITEQLAGDSSYRVRRAVAGHRNLPIPALLQLVATRRRVSRRLPPRRRSFPSNTWNGC